MQGTKSQLSNIHLSDNTSFSSLFVHLNLICSLLLACSLLSKEASTYIWQIYERQTTTTTSNLYIPLTTCIARSDSIHITQFMQDQHLKWGHNIILLLVLLFRHKLHVFTHTNERRGCSSCTRIQLPQPEHCIFLAKARIRISCVDALVSE